MLVFDQEPIEGVVSAVFSDEKQAVLIDCQKPKLLNNGFNSYCFERLVVLSEDAFKFIPGKEKTALVLFTDDEKPLKCSCTQVFRMNGVNNHYEPFYQLQPNI